MLSAIRQPAPPVLLIDEVDRADEAFEAFLLEVLSEFAVSIPELGTIEATSIPLVVLTSNGTRDLSDALRRRCLFHYADYPGFKRELAIVSAKLPDLDRRLQAQAVRFVQAVREWDIVKRPGITETLDWIQALNGFAVTDLVNCENVLESSLSCLFKTAEDRCFASRMMQQQRVADILSPMHESAGFSACRLTGFIDHLRRQDFPVTPDDAVRCAETLVSFDAPDPLLSCRVMRAVLCSSQEEWRVFGRIFRAYWASGRRLTRKGRMSLKAVTGLHVLRESAVRRGRRMICTIRFTERPAAPDARMPWPARITGFWTTGLP